MAKQKQKTLEINLDEIKNPHPEILRTFKENDAMHLFFQYRPEIANEEAVFMSARASKKPIKHVITGLYRKRLGKMEWVFWHEEIIAFDYFNNVVMHNRMVGRYEKPIIKKEFGLNPAMMKGNTNINEMMEAQTKEVSIDSLETVYEFEFEAIKPQLLKWKEQNIISDKTPLYVWDGDGKTSKYSKPYTWEEWINLSCDDLVLLGKFAAKFNGLLDGNPNEVTTQILKTLRQTITKDLQSGLMQELKST